VWVIDSKEICTDVIITKATKLKENIAN